MEYETKRYLMKVKHIVDNVVELLEKNLENINNNTLTDEQKNTLELVIGKKENVISALLKLTNIILKIQPFETNDSFVLSEIDVDIINDFLKKHSYNQKKLD